MNKVNIVIILLLILLSGCNDPGSRVNYPAAENGYLDLSNWDFTNNGPVDLCGDWKFKWMEDDAGFINSEHDDSGWDTYPVPSRWCDHIKDYNGFCWLRLTVKVSTNVKLGLYLWGAETAYSLYVNGIKVIKNGNSGNTPETAVPDFLPMSNTLPESDTLTIAWKISNFNETDRGGPTYAPRIGIYEELNEEYIHNIIYNTIILGIILMMGIYHVLLWLGRKEDSGSILFALFCFLIFIRALCTSALLSILFPDFNVYLLKMKLEFLTISVCPLIFITFLERIYPDEFNPIHIRILQAAGLVLSIFILLTPIHIYLYSLLFLEIYIIIIVIFSLYSVISAVIHKRSESGIVLSGILLLFLTVINDILYTQKIINTSYIAQTGFVMLIFSLSAVLSMRSAKAHRTAEHLSLNLRKEVDEQTKIIKKQNEEKTNYFINLAHETKTPLTLILNYFDKYITRKGMDNELAVIKENLGKLNKNMVNFLDYEKLERGQNFYDHSQVINLSDALEQSLKLFKETAEKCRINLVTENIMNNALINADPYAVSRIINNLLDNAIKYTNSGGTVTVNLENNKQIIFSVRDNGIGIPGELLENIFEPYYQVSRKKRNIQGIGMGLNIVKKIMDDLGGKIEVKSEVDKGSEFRLLFKKYSGNKKSEILQENSEYPVKLLYKEISEHNKEVPEKYSILVVEDNIDMLFYLKEELIEYYNVFTAENGRKALEKISVIKKVHLVISDIMMDEMDGFEFYKELKKNEIYRATPFIFLTARNTQHDKLKALTGGAVDYISKPFDIVELRAKIYSIIKLGEYQFERNKAQLIKNIIKVNYQSSVNEDYFTLNFENICYKYEISSREKEVILLLLEGKKNKEIGEKLFISDNTVKFHIKNIYSKFDVNSKIELINIFHYSS